MLSGTATNNVPPRRALLASALTLAAGLIHTAAAVPHFGADTLLGTGFVLTGWAQTVIAALLLRRSPSRRVAVAGIAVHATALVALVASRTVGLPVGHGGVEPMAFPDWMTAALEGAGIAVLASWLARPVALTRRARFGAVASVAGAWLLALAGSTLAVADLGTSGHGDAGAARGHPGDGHGANAGAATDVHGEDGVALAASDVAHGHADGSVHVHEPGRTHHGHDDGTVHVHPARSGAGGTEDQAPVNEPSSTAEEGHSHVPGERHG